ncbi:MAG: SH3 domain-containing protein [Betaproteobacteria bacterium]|jgi:uncharacterized protein YraI
MAVLAALPLAGAAPAALAQGREALTNRNVHLRAGPAREYPVVAVLSAGTRVWVHGCLQAYTWCDVSAGPDRGWVYARGISFEMQRQTVPLPGLAPEFGIGIIGFLLGSYWTDHYRDRPWYGDRDRWRPLPPPLPAPPMGPPFRPPPRAQPPAPPRPHPPEQAPAPGRIHPPGQDHRPPAPPHRDEPPERAAPAPRAAPPQARPTPAPSPPRAAERKSGPDPDEKEDSRRHIRPPGRPTTP